MRLPILACATAFALVASTIGYEVTISEKDALREVCSGMWANDKTFINGERAQQVG